VYVEALQHWDPPKPKLPKSGKRRPKGSPPVTPEEKVAIARENGKKGGRPVGSLGILPVEALKTLRMVQFRLRKELAEDPVLAEPASDLAQFARERVALVTAGRIPSKRAPSVLKGAQQMLGELCEPVETVQHVKGEFDLHSAIMQAQRLEGAERQARPPLPEPKPDPAALPPIIRKAPCDT
jgi:hypothetical protein